MENELNELNEDINEDINEVEEVTKARSVEGNCPKCNGSLELRSKLIGHDYFHHIACVDCNAISEEGFTPDWVYRNFFFRNVSQEERQKKIEHAKQYALELMQKFDYAETTSEDEMDAIDAMVRTEMDMVED